MKVHIHWLWFGLFVYVAAVVALMIGDAASHRPIGFLTAFLAAVIAPIVGVPAGMGIVHLMRGRTKEKLP